MAVATKGRERGARAMGPAVDVESIWILRALAGIDGSKKPQWSLCEEEWFEAPDPVDVSLLGGLLGERPQRLAKLAPAERLQLVRRRLAQLEGAVVRREGVVFDNARRLGDWLGFSEVEQDLLLLRRLGAHEHALAAGGNGARGAFEPAPDRAAHPCPRPPRARHRPRARPRWAARGRGTGAH